MNLSLKRRASAALLFLCIIAPLSSCNVRDRNDNNVNASASNCKSSRTQAAISTLVYDGMSLPPKTIALTYDDGPGVRTRELSQYLKSEGIPATFFVNGRMVAQANAALGGGGDVLADLVNDGHLIGNHTQTHADLTKLPTNEAILAEVEETDHLIAPLVKNNHFLFRPPFGAFDEKTSGALQQTAMNKYVGPIGWDIGSMHAPPSQAADWACWRPTPVPLTAIACGDLYLTEIRARGKGIILFHDPYFIDDDPTKDGTVDMTKYIVPILKSEGFSFVTVEDVPAIKAALPPPSEGGADAGTSGEHVPPTSSSAPPPNGTGGEVPPCE